MEFVGALGLLGMLAASSHQVPSLNPSPIPEENYAFLSVTDGPCVFKLGVGMDPKYEFECRSMTELRRYRGIWQVEFEGSFFTPVGKRDCLETRGVSDCAELIGRALPWPSRWACSRRFEVEFIGRRNVLPRDEPLAYRITVDKLIAAKRLPDPEDDNCKAPAP